MHCILKLSNLGLRLVAIAMSRNNSSRLQCTSLVCFARGTHEAESIITEPIKSQYSVSLIELVVRNVFVLGFPKFLQLTKTEVRSHVTQRVVVIHFFRFCLVTTKRSGTTLLKFLYWLSTLE